MRTRAERRLEAIDEKRSEKAAAIKAIWDKAEEDERETTDEERREVEALMKSIDTLNVELEDAQREVAVEKEIREHAKTLGGTEKAVTNGDARVVHESARSKSLGDQFIESDQYKAMIEKGLRGDWGTGQIELKATLLEGDNTQLEGGTPGAGGVLVPIDRRPGIVETLYERLTIANLLASGQTTANAIQYVKETVATNAAATVAEGADKPESTLEFDQESTPVRKIATFLPVSDEMLEDAPAIRGYINGRLGLFVQQEEESQLLNGAGAGTDLVGLLDQVPSGNEDVESDAASPNMADHIFAGITQVRTVSFLEPDGVVVNSDDWAELRLLKDGNENYIGGSPFSNGIGQPVETLWGKRVVVTSAIAAGTALVGAFGIAAQVFRKGGLTVEASNSHSDFFKKNLTAIRAEERLALAVYRPQAFATVATGTVGS